MIRELKKAQEVIREYAKQSNSNTFGNTDLKTLYRDIGRVRVFLEDHESVKFIRRCSGCAHWHPAPRAKSGWCSKAHGYQFGKAYCSEAEPRTEDQKHIDEYIRRRLEERGNDNN